MKIPRRQFTAAIATLLSTTTGCVGRRWWENDTESNEQDPSPTKESGNKGTQNDDTTHGSPEPTGENETGAGPEPDAGNESESEPVEDSTRPVSVAVDDAVTANIEHDVRHDVGVFVWGSIENITDAPIDQVSVTVRLYNGDGRKYHEMTDGTFGLLGGDIWKFELAARNTQYADQYDRHEVDVNARQLE